MFQDQISFADLDESTWCSAGLPVSPSALRDAVKQLVTNVTCGRTSCGSFASLDQDGLWQKTQPESFPLKRLKATKGNGQKVSSLARSCAILPRWGIAADGVCGAPVTWARRTSGSGFLSWPTPDTQNHRDGSKTRKAAKGMHAVSLHHAVYLWPTIAASDGNHGGPNQTFGRGNPHLPSAVLWEPMWPTATAHDSMGARGANNTFSDSHYDAHDLVTAVMWATPAAQDSESTTLPPSQAERDTLPGNVLSELWATPTTPNGGRVSKQPMSPTGMLPDGRKRQVGLENQVKVQSGLVLNPEWVECLMGLPIGWTEPAGLPAEDRPSTRGSRPE
jgi:hypothetical protein